MKEFKFLQKVILETDFRPQIIQAVYDLCKIAIEHRKTCEVNFLKENPQINPATDHYSFPIDHVEIYDTFIEGKLWHCTMDLDEDMDIVYHTVFLDPFHGDDYHFFTIHQDENENLTIYEIGEDTNLDSSEY